MSFRVENTTIERISIIDDDEVARDSYGFSVEELGPMAVKESGPLRDLQGFLKQLHSQVDAVICDYHLRKIGHYATFDGDEVVVGCYKKRLPAVLCTFYTDVDVDLLRSRRRYIPSLLKPDEFSPESVASGLERCFSEFSGRFQPSRKPWRTLVRVEEVERERGFFYVIVPGWNPRKKIRVSIEDLSDDIQRLVEPDKRFHAQVNVGAENHEDLYFDEWEVD